MLEVRNVSKIYKNNHGTNIVFKNISFNIKKGEFVSILGPSGCGKTTLVNIIAGYINPDKGSVFFNNETIMRPGRDRIVINQEDDLFAWMTVYENIFLINNNNDKINELLALTDLTEYQNYYPQMLSGGMKKRLSLARALAADSDFIIMDEPFSYQDAQIRGRLYEDLLKITKKFNKTTLLVTHNIDEAIFLSDRIIALGGRPTKIVKEYKIAFKKPKEGVINYNLKYQELKTQLRQLGYSI